MEPGDLREPEVGEHHHLHVQGGRRGRGLRRYVHVHQHTGKRHTCRTWTSPASAPKDLTLFFREGKKVWEESSRFYGKKNHARSMSMVVESCTSIMTMVCATLKHSKRGWMTELTREGID